VCHQNNIAQRGNITFLRVGNDWYAYDRTAQPLGQGAMGIVYKGWRTRDNLPVAMKRVMPQYANIPSIRARARLEASMQFGHPNVVDMLGCWEQSHDRGDMFIISKLVHGITLGEHIEQHGLRNMPDSTRRICETFYPVLDALEYLHSRDIIHLDIKPSNIMLENGYNIRLMDLGIAFTHDAVRVTSPGILGTAEYAAPEQELKIGDTRLDIDATTDLYELGVTLYEMLSGRNPFSGHTIEEAMKLHNTITLPPINGVKKPVMDVILKATSRNKTDRYQSAAEFQQALRQAARSKPSMLKRLWGRIFG